MGRHSKAKKKNICWIAHACTYKYTTKTLAGPASNTKINRQEKASPPITSDEEQELNDLEYSASGPGDWWGEGIGWDTKEYLDGLGDEDEELSELSGGDLCKSLRTRIEGEMKKLANAEQSNQSAYTAIMQELSDKDLRKLEAQRGLGYNGKAERTKRKHRQNVWEKEWSKKLQNSWVAQLLW